MTTTTTTNLGQITSQVLAICEAHWEAQGYDAGFDGGEFSGPAHERAMNREVRELLADNGLTIREWIEQVERATTPKWAFDHVPSFDYDDEPSHRIVCKNRPPRIAALDRDERDYCERGTQGCCIDHTTEASLGYDESCETW